MPSDQDIAVASDVANYEFTFASLDVGVMVSAIMMVSLGFSLVIFVGVHSWLIMTGKTTLEAGEGGSSAYNFGAYRNLCLVLGAEPKWWLWPDQPKEVDDTTRQGTDFRRYIGDPYQYPAMHYPGIGVVGGEEDAEATRADAELGAVAGGSRATPARTTDGSDDDGDDGDDDAARVPAVMAPRMSMSMDTGTLSTLQAGHHHEPADSALVMAR